MTFSKYQALSRAAFGALNTHQDRYSAACVTVNKHQDRSGAASVTLRASTGIVPGVPGSCQGSSGVEQVPGSLWDRICDVVSPRIVHRTACVMLNKYRDHSRVE